MRIRKCRRRRRRRFDLNILLFRRDTLNTK